MGRKITVTPNVEYSLKVLEKTVKGLPDGETKDHANGAIEYLMKTVRAGRPQARSSVDCPDPLRVFPPG